MINSTSSNEDHYSSLPKVTGEPTFEDLKVIRRLLNTNAMSVAS
jgi:hypothetical protein